MENKFAQGYRGQAPRQHAYRAYRHGVGDAVEMMVIVVLDEKS